MEFSIWVGFDRREAAAFAVTRHSVTRRLILPIGVRGLIEPELRAAGLFTRPVERRVINGAAVTWDQISDAPVSTDHANARFLVPTLAGGGWALFMDGDMLARANVARVFDNLDPGMALYCVQHDHAPANAVKMDGQPQSRYARKNWSSFMLINCDHPANAALTPELINTVPGRDLHRFCWLDPALIGALTPEWNFLVGHSDPVIVPRVVHFTDGTPDMAGYADVPYADEWRAELARWAA